MSSSSHSITICSHTGFGSGIKDIALPVILCLIGYLTNNLGTDRRPSIDFADVRQAHGHRIRHILQLIPADIRLHTFLPFGIERTVFREGQALALLLLLYALHLALDPVLTGATDGGEDFSCHPVNEGIRLRFVAPERQFVESGFVDDR